MKDAKDIIIIIGLLFQYYFNISAPNIVLCIQCDKKKYCAKTGMGWGGHDGRLRRKTMLQGVV